MIFHFLPHLVSVVRHQILLVVVVVVAAVDAIAQPDGPAPVAEPFVSTVADAEAQLDELAPIE